MIMMMSPWISNNERGKKSGAPRTGKSSGAHVPSEAMVTITMGAGQQNSNYT